jgi:iron complex outermembrane receptor protein
MRIQHALFVVGTIGMAAAMHVARAAEEASASGEALQEIVVTAQKREGTEQKTPISMNVYAGAEISQKDIVDLQALGQTDPNLVFNRNGGEATLAVRGVTTNNTTEIGNPAVPVGVDNFFVNRAAALDSMLFDVQRIEVLLGPQGTLFGRSAIGGLVNITTNKPTKDFEAGGSLELGNYEAVNATGMLNLPVNDWLQLRVAVSSRDHQGYRTDSAAELGSVPARADDEDSHAGRVTAAFEPTDHFKGWVSFQEEIQSGTGSGLRQIPFVYLPGTTVPDSILSHAKPDLGSSSSYPWYGDPFLRTTDKVTKWNFSYDGIPGGITAQYLGGYDSYEWRHSTNSSTFFGFLETTDNPFLPIRPYIQTEEPKTQNHELRIASSTDGFLTWQGGFYYFKELNNLNSQGIENPGQPDAAPLLQFVYGVKTESKAVYWQGDAHVTDNSQLTVGARYSWDDLTRIGTIALPVYGVPAFPDNGTYTSDKATWHLGYDYSLTSANLLYAKVDTGYKPGGLGACGNFKSEEVTTGEIGSKNRWADNTVQFNAAAFYSDYKDQQIDQFINTCDAGSVTTNAGKSRIYGFESDFKILVEPIGTADLGLSLLHATYSTLALPPSYGSAIATATTPSACPGAQSSSNAQNCNLNGNTAVQSPKYVISAGLDHVWHADPADIDLRVEGRYTAKIYFDPFNYADTTQPGFALLNAYLNYKRDNWSVGLYGRNLANKTYLNYAQETTTGGAAEYDYSYGDPRVFGIRFEAHLK